MATRTVETLDFDAGTAASHTTGIQEGESVNETTTDALTVTPEAAARHRIRAGYTRTA